PAGPVPRAVAVGTDGGRMMTRVTTTGEGPGVHGHGCKEDKVACLHVLEGPTVAADPKPQPPACFLDAAYVDELVRDFSVAHGGLPPIEEVEAAAAGAGAAALAAPATPAAGDTVPAVTAAEAVVSVPAAADPAGAASADMPVSTETLPMHRVVPAAAEPVAASGTASVAFADMPVSTEAAAPGHR